MAGLSVDPESPSFLNDVSLDRIRRNVFYWRLKYGSFAPIEVD